MTELETLALSAALAAIAKIEPALATAVNNAFMAFVTKTPLTPALKHLEAVADAKALGLNPDKV